VLSAVKFFYRKERKVFFDMLSFVKRQSSQSFVFSAVKKNSEYEIFYVDPKKLILFFRL